ncbi:type II secretion system F family protein [Fumia xinanensis]|uniref:Flp pilus assembly protein TadB n=1 Tax=Fumia xinanensis TaxID=2763659 RepID=A0A926E308_9FIRM|nr:hypothetical protein [Fumia xinanensis]MBC8560749.1 hypothetical protein [Fumia xinanensis]
MSILIVLAFIGFLAGIFLLLDMSPFEFLTNLTQSFAVRHKSLARQIKEIRHPKEPKGIKKTLREVKETLELMGKSGQFAALCTLSFFLLIVGCLFCILIQNYFMLPILAVGMALLPFWYIIFTSHNYKKMINNEVETALSVITTSYLRSESIITAVAENIDYLHPPVSDVFRSFLAETSVITTDVKQALLSLKPKLQNAVFWEWIDAAVACQDDKTLKSTLTPIVEKLSDMRIVSAELDYLMYEPLKEFITMALLLVGNIPLLYFLNRDWYLTLVTTGVGKAILAVCVLTLFISFAAVIRLTRPVEYKR